MKTRSSTPVVLGEEADDGVKPLRMRVALPKACIGPCEITARYSLAARGPEPDATGTSTCRWSCRWTRNLPATTSWSPRGPSSKSKSLAGVWTAVEGGLGQAASPRTREFAAAQATAEIVLKLRRRKQRRCGRGGRPGVDPDLPDQIAGRGAAGSRRAAIHHAAARTGDHAARRGRPRPGLRAVERCTRHAARRGPSGS